MLYQGSIHYPVGKLVLDYKREIDSPILFGAVNFPFVV